MRLYILVFVLLMIFNHEGIAQRADYDSIYLLRNCVILDAKESVQDERKDLIYKWHFGDGEEGFGEVVEHCYDSLGTYEIMLAIVDPKVLSIVKDEWFFEVTITEDYKLTFELEKEANEVNVDSKFFSENDPGLIHFMWDFGDGSYGVGESAKHEYDSAGQYTIRLLTRIKNEDEVVHLSNSKTIQIN